MPRLMTGTATLAVEFFRLCHGTFLHIIITSITTGTAMRLLLQCRCLVATHSDGSALTRSVSRVIIRTSTTAIGIFDQEKTSLRLGFMPRKLLAGGANCATGSHWHGMRSR